MRPSRVLSFHLLAVIAAAATLLRLQMASFADDPGVGWHLASGAWILQARSIPRLDPFLASQAARPWISDQWLSDLLLYALYLAGSWAALYAVLTALYLYAYMGLTYRCAREYCGSALAASAAAFAALKLGLVHFILRPVLFSFALFAALLPSLLRLYRRADQGGRPPPREIVFCSALLLLWCNLHPSFVVGIGLLALLPAALVIDKFFFDRPVPSAAVHHALLLLVCGALITLLNPFGTELHRSILDLWSSSYFSGLHTEWRSLDFRSLEGASLELMLLIVVIGAYAGRTARRHFTFELLAALLFLHLTLKHARFLPYLGLVLAPLAAQSLCSLRSAARFWELPPVRIFLRALRRLEDLEAGHPRGGLAAAAGLILIGCAFFLGDLPGGPAELGPQRTVYPYRALDAIQASLPAGGPCIVLSHPNWGGFILWRSGGRCRPLIDDRNTLVGESFHRQYMAHLQAAADDRSWLQSSAANYALLPPRRPLAEAAWSLAYEDEIALMYRRKP